MTRGRRGSLLLRRRAFPSPPPSRFIPAHSSSISSSKPVYPGAPPSLQPHYRAFTATTSRSAPVPRIGTLPLAVSAPWGPPSRDQNRRTSPISSGRRYRGDRFSCSMPAPATSSRHLYTGRHQGSTQPAPWLRARPAGGPLSRRYPQPPVSAPSFYVSMRLQWFIHVRLLVAHLTRFSEPFPQSLPTPALNRHDTAAV